jgi:pSer/pThr/pTyr-binding forkhead associated (FHA) protein
MDSSDAFCQNCGADLAFNSAPTHGLPSEPVEPATLAEQPKPAARLVVSASSEEIVLDLSREEWVVGRTDPQRGIYPDIDLSPHGGDKNGVSRRHARLVTQGGRRWISDLNSTNFTFLNGEKLEPGGYYPLTSGDQIRFGLLTLRYIEENAE